MGKNLAYEICLGESCNLKVKKYKYDSKEICECDKLDCETSVRNSQLPALLFGKFEKKGSDLSGHMTYEDLMEILLDFLDKQTRLNCFLFGIESTYEETYFHLHDENEPDCLEITFFKEIAYVLEEMKGRGAKCVWFYYG